ncbi:hypothetical protein [Advenella mimigardefordensis]|uniref:hypothetical protein n=1 Tax=Advenella mimigardefordensis TaxID=302406 RepID=UPI00046D8100|nr:hypothetical protein [Advenella mimigardefordensis]
MTHAWTRKKTPQKLDINPIFGVFFMTKYDEQFKLPVVQNAEASGQGVARLPSRHAYFATPCPASNMRVPNI